MSAQGSLLGSKMDLEISSFFRTPLVCGSMISPSLFTYTFIGCKDDLFT